SAAYALGILNDRRAVSPLIGRLRDDDVAVRLNSVQALGRLKDPRALEPVRDVAKSDAVGSVREAASMAIDAIERPNPKRDQ
ncbi:MAG: HEAT repeat domain-containing protein, partial [Acidobacteria bacterium]|nr:HEAT repeat domain-containing protein [Acidobacteriota bacterium]